MDEGLTCPGCGVTVVFTVAEKNSAYSVLRCPQCEMEFSHPMKNPGGAWYDKAYVIRHSAIDTRIRDYYRWSVETVPLRGTLLDIGCGEGVFVAYAKKCGFDAFGTDFSQEAIDLGRAWYGLSSLYNSSLSDLKKVHGFADFDIITFFEVLEHVDNPSEFLREVKTLLKDGGYIALSVPYNRRWPFREFNDYPPHHLTRWTEKALQLFLERNGFKVIKMKIGSGLSSYAIFLSYLVRLLVYKMFGYKPGLATDSAGTRTRTLRSPAVKRMLSAIRPRQIRDALIWPLALTTYPFTFPFFKGYNLMLVARKVH